MAHWEDGILPELVVLLSVIFQVDVHQEKQNKNEGSRFVSLLPC